MFKEIKSQLENFGRNSTTLRSGEEHQGKRTNAKDLRQALPVREKVKTLEW